MTRRIPDSVGIGLALLLGGLLCCALKWAWPALLADWPWWQVLIWPTAAFAFEFVVLFVWFFTTGTDTKA